MGRRLANSETVDHIDGDFLNNAIENLQVLDRKSHITKDVKRVVVEDMICPMCGTRFSPTKSQYNNPSVPHFCSRRCSGLYGKSIQKGAKKIEPQESKKIYYTNR